MKIAVTYVTDKFSNILGIQSNLSFIQPKTEKSSRKKLLTAAAAGTARSQDFYPRWALTPLYAEA